MDKRIKKVPNHIGWFIAGFIDGEGSFTCRVKKMNYKDRKMLYKVDLVFSVCQKEKPIIALIRRYLGCGIVYQRNDGAWCLEVNNLNALRESVIPFFNKFKFLSSSKKKAFSIFKRLVEMKLQNYHLTTEGLTKILRLREKLNQNKGRNKKYQLADILRDLTPDTEEGS
jgi:hypothetical protein